MLSLFIGVYRVLYEYTSQSAEELSIQPDDVLYLLEKSNIDDWWKVKKRVVSTLEEVVDEPIGLVPSNYIEQATALYDYDKQTEEELSFAEGQRFNVYDTSDPDWYLVGDEHSQTFGFIPSNYIRIDSNDLASGPQQNMFMGQQSQQPQQPQPQAPSQLPISSFAPPPVHKDLIPAVPASEPSVEKAGQDSSRRERQQIIDSDDEAPPPMPTRPRGASGATAAAIPDPSNHQEDGNNDGLEQKHNFDGEFFTWFIDEVEGRRKRAVVFSIGQGMIILKPNTSNPKKSRLKSTSSLDQEWKVKNLIDFSHEKKHVFLELKNPDASIELHTGSKDVAEAIVSILGDIKGAEAAKGLREVARASQASTSNSNKKIGRLLYDFESQGSDELEAREGDEVYIINESKSEDWWLCENVDTKKQGVIPSSYIEIISTSNLDKLTDSSHRRKSLRSSKGRVVEGESERRKSRSSRHHRSRDERERIRENDRQRRDKGNQSPYPNDKSMPNPHRIRTWIDCSGSFKVEAEFLGLVEGKIHLHKTNGVKIAVAAAKLSIEDLEYVEKITGSSLETYKEEVQKLLAKKARSHKQSGVTQSATAAINDISPPQPSKSRTTTSISTGEPEYDWFEFFLSCGVDIGNCQRYTLNFNREQMDENILEDINPSLLRTLGLREGDILRVMKFLDNKFDRKKSVPDSNLPGGLFTEPTGALKNNSSSEIHKIDANALPSSQKQPANDHLHPNNTIEDDAWAVKPAARSNEDLLSKPATPQQPQYTGSLQDLLNIRPLDLNNSGVQKSATETAPSAPSLTPVKTGPTQTQAPVASTGTNSNSNGMAPNQQTGTLVPVQRTGNLVPVQRTGNLVPVQQTGGFISAQPTGFIPITAQPTGFVPIQQTGGIQPQLTFGLVPLQTGTATFTGQSVAQQKTGDGIPTTTFGQQNPGVPPTTFGQPMLMQASGPAMPVQNMSSVPPTSFGQQISVQNTASLVPAQRTGGLQSFPPNAPLQQTGGFNGIGANGQNQINSNPQPTFGQPFNNFTGQNPGINGFPQQQQQQQQPPTQFTSGGQMTSGGQPFFNQTSMPQTSFGAMPQNTQPQFQTQPTMDSLSSMFQNTGISAPPTFNQPLQQQTQQQTQQLPNTTFGLQPTFTGFNSQSLQAQPTGAGFGNAPASLQSQPTGKRANLLAATPDNPFGF